MLLAPEAGTRRPAGAEPLPSHAPVAELPTQASPDGLERRLERFRALRVAASGVGAPAGTAAAPRPLARAVPQRDARTLARVLGGEVEETAHGRVVRVRASLRLPLDVARLATLPFPVDPTAPLCCLDTETTGLGTAAGTLVFMVGLGRWRGETFEVDQLVLPDQPDEPAFLEALRLLVPAGCWLVTYNGRTFDWPLLETRFRLRHGAPPGIAGHLDLLPVARRLWRHRLPDARLASVERGVAGVERHDDLPGALVPARYLAYLRTGRAEPLRAVVEHNRIDIISLARLLAELADRLADPQARTRAHPGDVAALARAYARRGRLEEGLACVDAALASASWTPARERMEVERARLLRRLGRVDEASRAWSTIAHGGGPQAALAWLELAKEREHRQQDRRAALEAVERAARLLERARLFGRPAPALERDVARRRRRLERRRAHRAA